MIADDRRRSQKIEHGSIFCDRLRSSAITIAGSQAIAEVCFHMIADDRRTAICDPRSSAIIWKPAFKDVFKGDEKNVSQNSREKIRDREPYVSDTKMHPFYYLAMAFKRLN